MLVQAPTDRDFSLTDSRSARRLKPEQIKLMNDSRPLLADNVLTERIGSVVPFVDVEDRAATAMQSYHVLQSCHSHAALSSTSTKGITEPICLYRNRDAVQIGQVSCGWHNVVMSIGRPCPLRAPSRIHADAVWLEQRFDGLCHSAHQLLVALANPVSKGICHCSAKGACFIVCQACTPYQEQGSISKKPPISTQADCL